MAQENEVIEYKVGDKVIITEGHSNWNPKKARFVGMIFTIRAVYPERYSNGQGYGYTVHFVENPLDNAGEEYLDRWTWQSHNGHFKHAKPKRGVKVEPPKRKLIFSESFLSWLRDVKEESRIARLIMACLDFERSGLGKLINHILTGEEISYITYRSDGTISYLPKGKEHKVTEDGKWSQEGRQNGKPAKVMRKIFSKTALKLFKETDFEVFNNKFRSRFSLDGYEFKVLPNVEIPSVYDMELEEGGSSLNGSCMKGHSEFMDLYATCKDLEIVILTNKETGELAGRALLWNATREDNGEKIKFLDRFYVNKDHFYEAFVEYATKNNLWYKKHYKTRECKNELFNPDTGVVEYLNLFVKTPTDFEQYPYIDTFQTGNDGILFNYIPDDGCKYEYDDTDGGRSGKVIDGITGEQYDSDDDFVTVTEGQYEGQYTHVNNTTEVGGAEGLWYIRDPRIVHTRYEGYHMRSECYMIRGYFYHISEIIKCGETESEDISLGEL